MQAFTLPDVQSNTWCLNLQAPGEVLQGIEALKQRIYIALSTKQGTDPLRPFFGTNIPDYIDYPINIAGPRIKTEIIDALNNYVPEITVKKITYAYADNGIANTAGGSVNSGLIFSITLQLGKEVFGVNMNVSSGVITFDADSGGTNIVEADIPDNADAYGVSLSINGVAASPAPPASFASIDDVTDWLDTNWGAYATWGIGIYHIVGYMKTGTAIVDFKINKV